MIPSLKNLTIQMCINQFDKILLEKRDEGENVLGLSTVGGLEEETPYGTKKFRLKENIFLPADLCEPILQGIIKVHSTCFLRLFNDRHKCQLRKIDLSNVDLNDQSLFTGLLVHSLEQLDVSKSMLKSETAKELRKLSTSLKILNLSSSYSTWKKSGAPFLKSLKKLSRLDISYPKNSSGLGNCLTTISMLENLEWLDLSDCCLEDISPLISLASSLKHLFLYNVCNSLANKNNLGSILVNMTSMTHLDISKEIYEEFIEQNSTEEYLNEEVLNSIGKLPNLVHLDISGCLGLQRQHLDALGENKLSFLGLFKTGLEYHEDISVTTITGLATEEQVLNSLDVYVRRASYMKQCLATITQIIYAVGCSSPPRALQLALVVAKAHLSSEEIQRAVSRCISLLIPSVMPTDNFNVELRLSMVPIVLDIMDAQRSPLIQNRCCLSLLFAGTPNMASEAKRVCETMLRILKVYSDSDLKKFALIIFNAIICCSHVRTVYAKKLGAVSIIMDIIIEKIAALEVDQIMETCWTVLWNITDETPENSEFFLKNDGMVLFTECLKEFEYELDLQKNMMGLMGNIAEVKHLRGTFMKQEYIEKFIEFLHNSDFEVSHNAAGILSHVTSDGEEAWTVTAISRRQCMESMTSAISSWDINHKRQMNYRSLEPILRLIPQSDTPAAQFWAAWALANLTQVQPEKYCELLLSEGGLGMLRCLMASPLTNEAIKTLAETTLKKITSCLGISVLE